MPCWRTITLPALTAWPPKSFTPRRFDIESRPSFVVPAAFVCAIFIYKCSESYKCEHPRSVGHSSDGVDRSLSLGGSPVLILIPIIYCYTILQMLENARKNLLFASGIALFVIAIFSLGYLTANLVVFQRPPIVVERIADSAYSTANKDTMQEGSVVASANSDKYHYLWCLSASRIKEENKIFFESASLAEAAGLTLAGNCK